MQTFSKTDFFLCITYFISFLKFALNYYFVDFLQRNKLLPVASYLKSAPINATFSPTAPEYVAFCSKGQLFVDK